MTLAWHVLRPHRAAWVLVAVAVAVVVASLVVVPRYLDVVADRRLDLALADGSEAATVVWSADLDAEFLGADSVDGIASALAAYPDTVGVPLRQTLGAPRWILAFPDVTAAAPDGHFVRLRWGSAPALQQSWRVVEGTAPAAWTGTGPVEVAMERAVADRLGATTGTTYVATEATAVVTAIVDSDRALPTTQGVFAHPTSERVNATDDLLTGGAYVDPGSVPALADALARAQLVAAFPVGGGTVTASDVTGLERAADKASTQGASLPNGYPVTVSSRLSALLHGLESEQRALETLAALLISAPWGAAILVSVVAVVTAERRRRNERILLSARGAGRGRIARMAGGEMLTASVPGALLGWALALAAVPDVPPSGLPMVIVAAAACAMLSAGVAVVATKPRGFPRLVRTAAEGVLLILTVVTVALFVTRGLPETGSDALLAATPLLIALAASAVLVRGIGLVLIPWSRRAWRGPRIGVSLALARIARGGGRFLSVAGVVIAVATLTSAVGLLFVAGAGVARAAEQTVGADVRACGGATGVAEPDAAGAVAQLRTLSGIPVTDDGRLSAVTVLAADITDLHLVQPEIPDLAASGTAEPLVLSSSAAQLLDGDLQVGGRPVSAAAVVPDATLPTNEGTWVLVGDAFADALDAPADSVCDLIRARPGADVATLAADVRADRPGADVVDVASESARRTAEPTVSALAGVLTGASVVALLAALALAVFDSVGSAADRGRTRSVLSMIGADRVRGLVLAEAVPITATAAIVGWGVGWAVITVVVGSSGVGDRLGIAVDIPAIAVPATAGAAAVVAIAAMGATVGTAMLAARRRGRRDERQE